VAIAVGAVLVTVAASACGSSGGSGAAGGSSGKNFDITIELPDAPADVDPCMTTFGATGRVLRENVTETLTEKDPAKNTIVPLLATSWKQVSPDVWQFTLRHNVKFSDGTPWNAANAAISVKRQMDPKLGCHNYTQDLTNVAAVSAPAPYTLQVTTKIPDPIIPFEFAEVDMSSPKTPANQLTNDPIGTGPYKFSSYSAQQSVKLVRNPGYWGKKPDVDQVTYLFQSDPSIRAAAVQSGQADLTVDLPNQFASGKGASTFPIADVAFLWIGMDEAPFNNLLVREAINYAINRKELISAVFGGLGAPASQLVIKSVNGFNPSIQVWPYDPAKAKSLLAQAKAQGVPVNKQIELAMEPGEVGTNGTEFVEAVAAQLQAVGFQLHIVNLTQANHTQYITKPYAAGRQPYLQVHDHGNTLGDSYSTFARYIETSGLESANTDKTIDQLVVQSSQATGAARTQLLQQVWQRAIVTDAQYAPLVDVYDVGMTSSRIRYSFPPNVQDELHIDEIHAAG
jgi:peptide/nickel transport system substrate-binding protein